MELRQMQMVVAVADYGGFTAAAQRLHVVQATVSTAVRSVERELGARLFERTTHRVDLTAAGAAFVEAARRTLDAAREVTAAVDSAQGLVRGIVSVGVMQGLHGGLGAALRRLRTRHPNVRIRLRQAPAATVVRELRRRELDVGVLAMSGHSLAGLVQVPLVAEDLLLVYGDDCGIDPGETVTLEEITRLAESGVDLIDFPSGWAIRSVVDAAFTAAGIQRSAVFEVNELLTVADLVGQGLGVSLLPLSLARRFAELRTAEVVPVAPRWSISALHPDAGLSPATEALLTELQTRPTG